MTGAPGVAPRLAQLLPRREPRVGRRWRQQGGRRGRLWFSRLAVGGLLRHLGGRSVQVSVAGALCRRSNIPTKAGAPRLLWSLGRHRADGMRCGRLQGGVALLIGGRTARHYVWSICNIKLIFYNCGNESLRPCYNRWWHDVTLSHRNTDCHI